MSFDLKSFEHIQPYPDSEIRPALIRIAENPFFETIAGFVFPNKSTVETKELFCSFQTADEFQEKFVYYIVKRIVETSSNGLTYEGFDKLDIHKPYLFIANHRDIVLDSAILQTILVDHKMPTSEITFGSNLMISPFIIDLGKVNKMFTVIRGGTKSELINNTKVLSAYIRYTITKKHQSIWIAQRNGRTKNGQDKTELALLKMLRLSGNENFIDNISELNIIPLTISYEYEPCGLQKVNELYQSTIIDYKKDQDEDFKSIMNGFTQDKGRIHLCAGKPVNSALSNFDKNKSSNENIQTLATFIDQQIHDNYMLWKTNYIAYDLLNNSSDFHQHYTNGEKDKFICFVDNEMDKLAGDRNVLKEMYLQLYANPVISRSYYNQ